MTVIIVLVAFLGGIFGLLLLLITQYFIEPKKWQRNIDYEKKKETLLAYGKLLEICDHAKARNLSFSTNTVDNDGEPMKHTLSSIDKKIFRDCTLHDYHYYSEQIRVLINGLVKKDPYVQLEDTSKTLSFLLIPMTQLEEQLKKEYDILNLM